MFLNTRLCRSNLRVLVSRDINPYFNLSFENHLFEKSDPNVNTLYLWQNDKSVIMGRNQNPWIECHLQSMESDKVNLVRRWSGGGCVYQDLGNMCFTFVSGKKNVERNNQILINALKSFQIEAIPSGRNDITVGGRKISGSAFKLQAGRHLHHGTMLMNVDMNAMLKYLNPNKKKLESKGVRSVVSRVVNLKELNPLINFNTLSDEIIKSFFESHQGTCEIEQVNVSTFTPLVKEEFEELSSDEWKFGKKTPEFKHHFETRFDFGVFDIYINSKDGKIDEIVIYSDTLYPDLISELCKYLQGSDYTFSGIEKAFNKTKEALPALEAQIIELFTWIKASI